MSKSALASITAQYTDSENEDGHEDDESADSQNSQVIIPKPPTPMQTPEKPTATTRKKKRSKKSVRRLVSYQDDTIISDEDDDHATESSDESESDQEMDDGGGASTSNNIGGGTHKDSGSGTAMEVDDLESSSSVKEVKSFSKSEKSAKYTHYGFTLPAEPRGKPTTELVEKIRNLYEKMETNNMDMNRIIQERKEFRNPSIYEKLIQFCDINEFGTNYPPEIYDPLQWGAESYYQELARVQKNEMLKRQKDRKETDKIEQATALARKVEEEAKKRKSKWDQPASAKPVVPPALTTTVTGTKGTVISAFGSLPKKPPA